MAPGPGTLLGTCILSALVLAVPAGAAGSQAFTDPSGDAGAAPDLTRVVVAHDDAGRLSFAITLANPAALAGDSYIAVGLNTDRNVSTGSPDGLEYAIFIDAAEEDFGQWDGSDFEAVPGAGLKRSGLEVSLPRGAIGDVRGFGFFVVSSGPDDARDDAPDGTAEWTYDLGSTPTPGPAPTVVGIQARWQPARPVAGKAFRLSVADVELDTGARVRPGSTACRATIAGRTIRAAGRCRWLIPRAARGRRLAVVVTAGYAGATRRFGPFRFRIR